MTRFHALPGIALLLGFLLGGSVLAQSTDTSASGSAAPVGAATVEAPSQPTPSSGALPSVAVPAPDAQPSPATPQDTPSASPTSNDRLAAELAALRAAVGALVVQNDSLARVLRTTTRDTTARNRAQETTDELVNTASDALQNFVPKLLISLVLIALSLYLVRGFVWLLDRLAQRSAERELFYKKLIPIVRLLVWAFTIFLIIDAVFNIPGDSLLAAAAAVGVAVGFAAQEVLKNVFGGIVIILDQPFQVGDKISVGGTYGTVTSIGLRSTRIVTPDDNLVSVPNSQVVADQVSNANAGELNLQVVTDLFLPGWVDVSLAKRIAYEAAANSKYVYLDKPIVVIVKDEFRETFLTHLKVKAYVLDRPYEFLLMSDVTEAAKAGFIEAGLLTPMPIGMDVDVDVDVDFDDGDDDSTSDGHASPPPGPDDDRAASDPLLVTPSRKDPPADTP